MLNTITKILGLGAVFILVSCSGTEESTRKRSVDEIYTEAMAAFNNEEWADALSQFDIIKLQYPASQYADDAQFRIAEINFHRGEYVMASYNYSVVRRSFPSSEWAKTSAYKVGLCYAELMLPPDRDQEYTMKAIQAFTEFQQLYPTDSLALVSVQRIHDLRNHLAERYLLVAEHYVKTESRRAALVYYDALINEYPDSDWLEDAFIGKLTIQSALGLTTDCKTTLAQYRKAIKQPKRENEVIEIERNLQ